MCTEEAALYSTYKFPGQKQREMQYTGGLLSAFVLTAKETDYASTRKPNTAYGIHK